MRGESQEKIIYKLTRDIVKNMAYLDSGDIEVLEFLSKKGDFETKRAFVGLNIADDKWEEILLEQFKQVEAFRKDFVTVSDEVESTSNKDKLIELLLGQVTQLTMMSKIELGDDVIEEIHSLQQKIKTDVPFVDEVEIFNEAFGKPNNYKPTINQFDGDFVYNFIIEEAEELKEAIKNNDIVEVLDALLDITYVSLGNGAMAFGLKDKILPGYAEVQASNMSKFCKTEEEAWRTVELRSQQQLEPCHFEKVGENYIVYRTRDHKVMKSINYFHPDLSTLFTPEELEGFDKTKWE
jgi:NTP pyrophosphatase (non-canonical NTP hydrolase)